MEGVGWMKLDEIVTDGDCNGRWWQRMATTTNDDIDGRQTIIDDNDNIWQLQWMVIAMITVMDHNYDDNSDERQLCRNLQWQQRRMAMVMDNNYDNDEWQQWWIVTATMTNNNCANNGATKRSASASSTAMVCKKEERIFFFFYFVFFFFSLLLLLLP